MPDVSDGGDDQRIEIDPPRLLHRRSEIGYTQAPTLGLPHELEAVSEHEQEAISLRARRDWLERRRSAWVETRRTIDDVLDVFVDTVGHDPPIKNAVRAVRRSVDAVGRR